MSRRGPSKTQSGETGARAASPSWRLAPWLIAAAVLIPYANSLWGPFVFDDYVAIVQNQTIRQLWPVSGPLHPPLQNPVAGRPLANLSFAINFAAGGLRVEGYHLWNIGVHVLAALALFAVLRRLLMRTVADRQLATRRDTLALICALAWAVHPLNTETVNYLTQRTDAMVGLFFLVALYAAVRAWEPRHRGRWEAAAIATAICGILTKEAMVTLPIVVALADRMFAYSSFRDGFIQRRRLYAGLTVVWVVFALLASQTPFFRSTGFETQVSTWTYLLNQAPVIAEYLTLSVWPVDLVFDYGVPRPLALTDVWVSAAALMLLLAATGYATWRRPAVGFWGAWFFITLSPASSLVPIPTEVGAERRMYLPLVAVIVVVAIGVDRLLTTVRERHLVSSIKVLNHAAVSAAVVVLLALAVLTVGRNLEYRSGVHLWETVVERRPHPRAHTNLASELLRAGHMDSAIRHLRIAAPEWPDARLPLGSVLAERGDLAEAELHLEEFTRLKPKSRDIIAGREELAGVLMRQNKRDRALEELRQIVSVAPGYIRGRINLGNMLLAQGDSASAAREYREVVKAEPANAIAWTQLGVALASRGDSTGAIDAFREAIRADGANLNARSMLLRVLLEQQRFADVEHEGRALLRLAPQHADAHNLLGVALASQQRVAEAVGHFAEAVRLKPDFAEARNNLALAINDRR